MNPLEWAQMGPGPGPNEWAQFHRSQSLEMLAETKNIHAANVVKKHVSEMSLWI